MILGDNMNKDKLWNEFVKTGKLEYYLEYKKLCGDGHDRKVRGNSNK